MEIGLSLAACFISFAGEFLPHRGKNSPATEVKYHAAAG
jgi:hypothetical protein